MAKRKRIYRANKSASFTDAEAAWIGELFEQFGEDMPAQTLVDMSRPDESPGHKLFVWDNDKAADAYRLVQAQQHLRMVTIEIVDQGEKKEVRAFYPVFHDDREAGAKRSYLTFDKLRSSPDLCRQVIEKAAHELKAWQRRYAQHKSVFGSVFTAIEELEKEVWPPQQQETVSPKSTRTDRRRKTAK